jgi:hypothetical protein
MAAQNLRKALDIRAPEKRPKVGKSLPEVTSLGPLIKSKYGLKSFPPKTLHAF